MPSVQSYTSSLSTYSKSHDSTGRANCVVVKNTIEIHQADTKSNRLNSKTESKVIRDEIQSHNGVSSTKTSTSPSVFASVSQFSSLDSNEQMRQAASIDTKLDNKTNDAQGTPINAAYLHLDDTVTTSVTAAASIPGERNHSKSDARLNTPHEGPTTISSPCHTFMEQSIFASHPKKVKKRKLIQDTNPNVKSTNIATNGTNSNVKRRAMASPYKSGTTGRWTTQEHQAFVRGLGLYGREWKRVALDIPTRTSAQVRSHAQKYLTKMEKQLSFVQDTPTIQPQESSDSYADTISPIHSNNRNGEIFTDGDYQLSPSQLGSTGRTGNKCCWDSANDGSPSQNDTENDYQAMSDSVRVQAARILANPTTVEQEVRDTLTQLRRRYQQLQGRIQLQFQEDVPVQQQTTTAGNTSDIAHEQLHQNIMLHRPLEVHQDRCSSSDFDNSTAISNRNNLGISLLPTTSSRADAPIVYAQQQQQHDDDELIALHVLQGLQKQQLRI